VASFDRRALAPFRGSGIAVGSSREDVARLLVPARLGIAIRAPGFDVMCIPRSYRGFPLPVRAFARALRQAGVLVHVWTVDEPKAARAMWDAGVHGLISNDPAAILAERRQRFGS
jgi:glycerophosphoryl diester phosphodiesterase